MSLLANFEQTYAEFRRNKWFRWFAVFSRVTLALGFIPAALAKLGGERFTGLPSNNPLGHYFDALVLTGFYYTFIGVTQLIAALLLLIPRTSLVGAILYFPIILNIFVLTHATRFDGTRIVTLMLFANIFLLVWDYDRLKYVLPSYGRAKYRDSAETSKFPFLFFGFVFAATFSIIVFNDFLFDIRPGNEEPECTNACTSGDNPSVCLHFCDCIYKRGNPLNACLTEYRKAKQVSATPGPVAAPRLQFSVALMKVEQVDGETGFACRGQDGLWRASLDVSANVINAPPGGCVGKNVHGEDLIAAAYNTPKNRIDVSVLPALSNNLSKYGVDIDATAENASTVTLEQLRVMLQNLLTDRFKLKFHRDAWNVPGCVLGIAEGGPKLKSVTGDMEPPTVVREGNSDVIRGKSNLTELVETLSRPLLRPALDRTGLSGTYEYTISLNRVLSPNRALPGAGGIESGNSLIVRNPREVSCEDGFADSAPGTGRNGVYEYDPPLATTLQKQLGLKIKTAPLQVESLVVDGLENPSQN